MGRNYRNSPVIGDNGLTASPQELSALTTNLKQNFIKCMDSPPVDLHNVDEVKQAILEYFTDCEESGKRPGNMGLYRALGMSRQDVNNVLTGKSKSKASLDVIDTIKKTVLLLAEYREQLGAQGKLNPVTMIFWQKNFDGLDETNKLEITAKPAQDPTLTPEEIQQQLEKDIPIDIE